MLLLANKAKQGKFSKMVADIGHFSSNRQKWDRNQTKGSVDNGNSQLEYIFLYFLSCQVEVCVMLCLKSISLSQNQSPRNHSVYDPMCTYTT